MRRNDDASRGRGQRSLFLLVLGLILVGGVAALLWPDLGPRLHSGLTGQAEAQDKTASPPAAPSSASPGASPAGGAAKPARKPAPVVEAVAVARAVPVELRAIGNVESSATVEIKARVNGEVVKVHFQEGQDVRKGDPLFTIDPRPFAAALKEAQARLEKDKALAAKARQDIRRYEELLAREFISREQYEQITATSESLAATVRADEAAVESARLQLTYATILSPIDGRAGVITADLGSMIKANDDKAMVTLERMEPVNVAFAVPEARLPAIQARLKTGRPPVLASPQGADGPPERGELSFIDNAVDVKTGTIKLKGTFSNKSRALWPGQFVNVTLEIGRQAEAVLAPAQAVQTGAEGEFLYVIRPDNTVEMRKIVVGRPIGQDMVIDSGLQAGERVVTDGQLRLTPGAPVESRPAAPAATPADAAPARKSMTFSTGG